MRQKGALVNCKTSEASIPTLSMPEDSSTSTVECQCCGTKDLFAILESSAAQAPVVHSHQQSSLQAYHGLRYLGDKLRRLTLEWKQEK